MTTNAAALERALLPDSPLASQNLSDDQIRLVYQDCRDSHWVDPVVAIAAVDAYQHRRAVVNDEAWLAARCVCLAAWAGYAARVGHATARVHLALVVVDRLAREIAELHANRSPGGDVRFSVLVAFDPGQGTHRVARSASQLAEGECAYGVHLDEDTRPEDLRVEIAGFVAQTLGSP